MRRDFLGAYVGRAYPVRETGVMDTFKPVGGRVELFDLWLGGYSSGVPLAAKLRTFSDRGALFTRPPDAPVSFLIEYYSYPVFTAPPPSPLFNPHFFFLTRCREGRLLRRFLTMARAKKSPRASLSGSSSKFRSSGAKVSSGAISSSFSAAFSRSSSIRGRRSNSFDGSGAAVDNNKAYAGEGNSDSTGAAADVMMVVGKGDSDGTAINNNTRAVKGEAEIGRKQGGGWVKGKAAQNGMRQEKEDQDWEDGGTGVGPEVVKAFINYFSKEVWGASAIDSGVTYPTVLFWCACACLCVLVCSCLLLFFLLFLLLSLFLLFSHAAVPV